MLAPHGHRRHVWPEGLHGRISRAAGWITPTVVVDGRIAGVWSIERYPSSAAIDMEMFGAPSKALRSKIEAEARSYETLLETPVVARVH